MNKGPFDNLPQLSKEDALKILNTPLNKLNLASDYYKAVFHISKYPSSETEEALLSLIRCKTSEQSILIAQRKAIEALGNMGSKKALPEFAHNLGHSDPYIVENSAWALQQIGCKDSQIHNLIGSLIGQPSQNQRVLIQSLSMMGATSQLKKIEEVFNKEDISLGVKGASLAAICRLKGQSFKINIFRTHLDANNQNDRQFAIQDIINANLYSLLDDIINTPVAPYFRLRAIKLLYPTLLNKSIQYDIISAIDMVLKDDPRSIRSLNKYDFQSNIDCLIKELFSVDFKRCYMSLQALILLDKKKLWICIRSYIEKFKKDYGALYFVLILIRELDIYEETMREEILDLLDHSLDTKWPNYMKFKPQAIINYSLIDPEYFIANIGNWMDIKQMPYWACRYGVLIGLEILIEKNIYTDSQYLKRISLYEDDEFVKLKLANILKIFDKNNI